MAPFVFQRALNVGQVTGTRNGQPFKFVKKGTKCGWEPGRELLEIHPEERLNRLMGGMNVR